MTQDLKELMDQATDRSTPFVPNLDQLLASGRRRSRTHLAVTMVSTVAAVGVAATAGVFALNQGGGTALPVAGQGSQSTKPKMVTTCIREADRGGNTSGTTDGPVILTVNDKYGASTVRHANKQHAFCIEFADGTPSVIDPPGARSKQWKPGQLQPNIVVWLTTPPHQKSDPAGPEIVTVFTGELPAKAVRVTVTPATGKPVDATIHDGFFLYRAIGRPDPTRPGIARIYDAAGHELEKYKL
jgi:hypothetical protein